MKQLIARLKYFFTGKHDPMDLLNGVYHDNLPKLPDLIEKIIRSNLELYKG